MPPSTRPDSYPPQYGRVLAHVFKTGELFIPHEKPSALRFSFYGYLKALRADGQEAFADSFALFIKHAPSPGVRIVLKEATSLAQTLEKVLIAAGEGPTENPLDRFLSGLPDNPEEAK